MNAAFRDEGDAHAARHTGRTAPCRRGPRLTEATGTVLLDLDGTLIDPGEGITESIRHALAAFGIDPPEASELTWCIGPPLRDSFAAILGEGADVERAVELYRAHYTAGAMFDADLYDGVGEMLEELRALGLALHIVTAKPHAHAGPIAEEFGLTSWVDGLFGSELDGTRGRKDELIAHALAETGADPTMTVMLGDRHHDIAGAHANSLIAVGALWGYAETDELHMAEADALAGHPREVPGIVTDFLAPGI